MRNPECVWKMTTLDKIGRAAWISFLVIAGPCALFCAGLVLIGVRMIFVDDIGPIEERHLANPEKAAIWFGLIANPILWIAGILFAHRFNNGYRAVLPFVSSMISIGVLIWIAVLLGLPEDGSSDWVVFYLGALVLLLMIGIGAVIFSNLPRTTIATYASHKPSCLDDLL